MKLSEWRSSNLALVVEVVGDLVGEVVEVGDRGGRLADWQMESGPDSGSGWGENWNSFLQEPRSCA